MHFRHHLKQKSRMDEIVRSYNHEEAIAGEEQYQESDFN
jgi:hypothetical protein